MKMLKKQCFRLKNAQIMDFDAHFFVAKPNALPKRRNRIPSLLDKVK